ncbi:DUF4123 domain-containing protein [Stenotrophomonas sp. GD03930]|uniref:DUF4123 domain-containing protein n=1 Tax=Stenotrophomonas TaxID=40323 RepID=UPI00018FED96|nr:MULTISPECIES: DUF4123 domain-containing protein [unclassified Stenotrophomonas]EED40994.1 conserved hypothetical protein [Stenotrophomonas sp. SKA14]MDH1233026.1 DUF4123 domain-containing protein [Stenotrophomonas sp. GD03930]HEL4296765.1 DUF4123 domain-containing protein [Stenotrophomonas maltophilia]
MQLDHRLFEAHQYALINPLQIDRRIAQLWPCEPIVPKELRGQEHLFPYLLRLGEMSADTRLAALDETVHYAREHDRVPFSALLVSDAGPEHVRNQLARGLVRKVDGERMLFRYYDPRVWSALTWILSTSQLDALLGPVQSWTAPSAKRDIWRTYESRGTGNDGLPLAPGQMHAISSLASINRVIDRLLRVDHGIDDHSVSKQVYDEILSADALGLSDADDQEAFAFVSITQPPGIHEAPMYQEAIRIARLEPGAYRSIVTAALEDDESEPPLKQQDQGVWQHG